MGQTINAEGREKAHRVKHGESGLLVQWKVNLAQVGLRPLMHRVGRVTRSSARRAERFTIEFCLLSRARLFNWFGSSLYQNSAGRSRLIRGVGFGRVASKPTKQYKHFLLHHYSQIHARLFGVGSTKHGESSTSMRPLKQPASRLPLLHKGHKLKPHRPTPQVPDMIIGRVPKSYVTVTPDCPNCGARGTVRRAEPPIETMTDGQNQDYQNGFREFLRCSQCGSSHWQMEGGQVSSISISRVQE